MKQVSPPSKATFLSLLRTYRKSGARLWSGWELALAIAMGTGLFCILRNEPNSLISLDKLAGLIFAASASVMGIAVAGFAISTAVLSGSFSNLLMQERILDKILFPFWFNSVLWMVSLFSSGVFFVFEEFTTNWVVTTVLASLSVVVFSLSVSFTVSMVGVVLKLTLLRGHFEQVNGKAKMEGPQAESHHKEIETV